jgi:maleate cis-trans isomerase
MTRVALIHALEESMAPARAAVQRHWPSAFAFDVLDTSLAIDRAHAGRLQPAFYERFVALATYAAGARGQSGSTAGILFTCSAFGPAIDAVKARVELPVLRPNESAFRLALKHGRSIGLVVSFDSSAESLEQELIAMAEAEGVGVKVSVAVASGALEALKAGDGRTHDSIVARVAQRLQDVDVVVLGQFSMARAAEAVADAGFAGRVITTPDAAVSELRDRILGDRSADTGGSRSIGRAT